MSRCRNNTLHANESDQTARFVAVFSSPSFIQRYLFKFLCDLQKYEDMIKILLNTYKFLEKIANLVSIFRKGKYLFQFLSK